MPSGGAPVFRNAVLLLGMAVVLAGQPGPAPAATPAWRDGAFHVDVPNLVRSNDVVLGRPNNGAAAAMPLGNGSLGVAVWDAGGLTAQLNRADTLPDRLSP